MKLVTYDRGGARRLGAWVAGTVVDVPEAVGHPAFPSTLEALVARNGGTTLDAAREALAHPSAVEEFGVARPRLLAPLLPSALRAFAGRGAGLSYVTRDHRTVLGPGEDLPWPSFTGELDFEVTVACVLGRAGRDVTAQEAGAMIFGYLLMNDWTARDLERRERSSGAGTGKSRDFATSLGPFLVTADEIEPSELRVRASVEGEVWTEVAFRDAGRTFPEMVAFASRGQDVSPGEVYGGGPLAGGSGADLRRRLCPGSTVEASADGLGALRTRILGPGAPRPRGRRPGAGTARIGRMTLLS